MPRKNVEYIPVLRNARTALEPMRLRTRRMRRGMIGLSIRASRARKPAIRAIAIAPKPSTWEDPQP